MSECQAWLVHVLDDGDGDWWHVEVVLRPSRESSDLSHELLALVCAALRDLVPVPPEVSPPQVAYSYDMPPPEGHLGVAIWVRAMGIGRAVEVACHVVTHSARELSPGVEPHLWDVRALPLAAVIGRVPQSATQRHRPLRRSRFARKAR